MLLKYGAHTYRSREAESDEATAKAQWWGQRSGCPGQPSGAEWAPRRASAWAAEWAGAGLVLVLAGLVGE